MEIEALESILAHDFKGVFFLLDNFKFPLFVYSMLEKSSLLLCLLCDRDSF